MRNTNSLWCVVERTVDGSNQVLREEVFHSRSDARDYLSAVKNSGISRPRSLFIRQLRVTNKRG